MIVYLDSSVVLRIVLGQPGQLEGWSSIERGIASALAEVECLRTMDRLRLQGALSVEASVEAHEGIYRLIEALEIVELSPAVMRRASQPMAVPLGTLDAIHLASADLWRQERGEELVMATHDRPLALAARAAGFRVQGV